MYAIRSYYAPSPEPAKSWRHAPQEYGAIHFHDDDLYDAGWETNFEYVVPTGLRSGVRNNFV